MLRNQIRLVRRLSLRGFPFVPMRVLSFLRGFLLDQAVFTKFFPWTHFMLYRASSKFSASS